MWRWLDRYCLPVFVIIVILAVCVMVCLFAWFAAGG